MIPSLVNKVKNYFLKRKEHRKIKEELESIEIGKWISKLYELGFKNISFPICIVYDEWDGIHLNTVEDITEFALTNSIHYWPLDYDTKLLDSRGNLWTWKYDEVNKTNLPGTIIKTLSMAEVKTLIIEGIINHKLEDEIKLKVDNASTIDKLFKELLEYDF
jgi:hypothetical protein